MPQTDNTRGAALMAVSMGFFAVNDALLKIAFESLPLTQAVLIRSGLGTIFILGLCWHTGFDRFHPTARDMMALATRSLCEVAATATFMVALSQMPLADAVALTQVAPLVLTMAAALLFGEPVRWRRWTAIGVGFLGVLIMIRPGGEGFDALSLLPLVTVVFVVVRDLVTRLLSPSTPAVFASLATLVTITVSSAIVMPFQGWHHASAVDFAVGAGAALAVTLGYLINVTALRLGEISVVSPFRYTVLVYSFVLGFVIFGDVPDVMTLVGATIVVGAGLYTLWREQRVGRKPVAASASPRPFAPLEGEANAERAETRVKVEP
ncbi:DMT family transporter [Acuticoccus mangrovi]|uniref:DMT family transporter n=1 Tax=Acuticoccus mangrovi TaxID=2796142 RepID=A0A934MEN6_9HYPH|nr:DMT family transporter [Acuticoccus mangrovi]MBJ3777732.1 DMT family transporter [Acuticoccus mangrovi]